MAALQAQSAPKVPYVTLEEHWLSLASAASMSDEDIAKQGFPPQKITQLRDVSSDGCRLAEMDKNGISLQIVSHAPVKVNEVASAFDTMPGTQSRASNDELANRIKDHKLSSRLKGFARLPMADPEQAAQELRRCVTDLGFLGSLVDNTLCAPGPTTKTVFYDHPAYDVLWHACCELDVPFYLHPAYPPQSETISQYRFEPAGSEGEGFNGYSSLALGTFAFGWHIDVGLHFLRLYAAGVFERFPKLKVVLGHCGESIPFFLERSAPIMGMAQRNLTRDLKTVWRENVWITTSGFWGEAPMAAALRVTSPDRIMFSVDWPFSSNEQGVQYMEWLWGSGLVTAEEWEGIAYKNCVKLFGWNESELQK